jgi:hypothetical protein
MALLVALILMFVVAAVGTGLLALTNDEVDMAGRQAVAVSARYGADAAVERVRADLAVQSDWSAIPGGVDRSALFDPSARPIAPWGQAIDVGAMTTELQDEAAVTWPLGLNTPRWRLFASGSLSDLLGAGTGLHAVYLLAWVADDAAETDGDAGVDTNGVLLLRVIAMGPGGRAVQALHVGLKHAGLASAPRVLAWREIR